MDDSLTFDGVTRIDVTVPFDDELQMKKGGLTVVKYLRSDWQDCDDLVIEVLTGGTTNVLLECYRKGKEDDRALIRVYGAKTELFIDRTAEIKTMLLLHEHKLAAPLYGAFCNGLCYGYNQGDVLDVKSVRDLHISEQIAVQLARMHAINYEERRQTEALLIPTLYQYLNLVPEQFGNDTDKNSRYHTFVPYIDDLKQEVQYLEKMLLSLNSPIVFCHNDLLIRNIIYHQSSDSVTFIDFEYAGLNYQAYDIGNHFCEYAGYEEFDSRRYPDPEFQRGWLRAYLTEWYRLTEQTTRLPVSDRDVNKLCDQVNQFALASCMVWTLWALIQSAHSTINFDFLRMASERLAMYWELKKATEHLVKVKNDVDA